MAEKYTRQAKLFAYKLSSQSLTGVMLDEVYPTIDAQAHILHDDFVIARRALGYIAPDEAVGEFAGHDQVDASIVDYDVLDNETRDTFMAQTASAKQLYTHVHKPIVMELGIVLYTMAEHIHTEWARDMLKDGWTYGSKDDDDAKISSALLPFNLLFNDPEHSHNCTYFINVARAMLQNITATVECINPVGKAAFAAGEGISKFTDKAKNFMQTLQADDIDD